MAGLRRALSSAPLHNWHFGWSWHVESISGAWTWYSSPPPEPGWPLQKEYLRVSGDTSRRRWSRTSVRRSASCCLPIPCPWGPTTSGRASRTEGAHARQLMCQANQLLTCPSIGSPDIWSAVSLFLFEALASVCLKNRIWTCAAPRQRANMPDCSTNTRAPGLLKNTLRAHSPNSTCVVPRA